MAFTFDNWEQTKNQVEDLTRRANKVEAEHKHTMEQLKELFQCSTIKKAKIKRKRLVRELNETFAIWAKKYPEFKKKWGKILKEE